MIHFRKPTTPLAAFPLLLGLILTPVSAAAQMAADTAANKEYMAAMEKMDKEMMAATDKDPTKSFAKKMAVHHQGAIEMSTIVLKHTQDKEIRQMAEKMIDEQQKEIKKLKDWVARHGG